MAVHCHNTPGLPGETLSEIHDMLMLALDASERPRYSQPEREARSYIRTALRRTERLIGGCGMSALHRHIQKQQALACDLAGLLEALSLIDNEADTPGAVTSLINVAMMLAADLTNNLDTVSLPRD